MTRLNQTARLLKATEPQDANWNRQLNELAVAASFMAHRTAPLYSREGMELVKAAYAVTECEALYELWGDIATDLGVGRDGTPLLFLDDRGEG